MNRFTQLITRTLLCAPLLGINLSIHAQNATATPPVSMIDNLTPLELEQADLAIQLAHSLAREKRYNEALHAYQEFVQVFAGSPRSREAHESMARIYELKQRYDLAIREYNTLYRNLGVTSIGLLYRLEAARLYEIEGNENAAVAIYKELNRLDPHSTAAQQARTRMESLNLMQKVGDTEKDNQLVKSSPQNE